ncbi:hypothetical protein San01_33410 [Streptomyces angustmyceticus]|uniref:Uncharacterized protein n=1 Tax=Streptomyces angustmyceticus TaxID=285578 RepID=A0A5J4LEB0_9ACTN|nr:hypothetical protein San01_33410 [Streptomyces angustmyceticus]
MIVYSTKTMIMYNAIFFACAISPDLPYAVPYGSACTSRLQSGECNHTCSITGVVPARPL